MWIGTLFGLTTAVLWSLANVSIQAASRRFGSWGALLWAQLIGWGIALVAAAVFEGAPGPIDGRIAVTLGVAGLSACVAYGGLFQALRVGQVAVVTPIISSWSAIAVAVAVVRLGTPITPVGAMGVALVVAGNVLIVRSVSGNTTAVVESRRAPRTSPAALGWAALSAVGFGTLVPSIDVAGAELGRIWTVVAVWCIELTVAVPLLALTRQIGPRPRGLVAWGVAARAALFEVGGFITLSVGLHHAPVTVVSPPSSLSTACSVALGLVLLRERLRPASLVGAATASIGIVLTNF